MMGRGSRVAQVGRHLEMLRRYFSFKKFFNLCRAFFCFLVGREKIPTMPAFLKAEVSRKCEMGCPLCWAYAKKEERFYPLDKFKRLIDLFSPWIFEVSLYDIGEPLWCENLNDYIRYAHQKRVGTSISTSLSLVKEDSYWEDLVRSGLDCLIVAIDGISEDVYKKYRRNGDLNLVMANLEKILAARKKYRAKLVIEWQMIDFEWNRHEQDAACRMSRKMGIDIFRLIQNAIPPRFEAQKDREFLRRRNCLLPYIIFIVNVFNEVNPCYKYYNEHMKIGDLEKESFAEIWNGENIAQIRSPRLIRQRKICNKCFEASLF